jgi:uncharacterized protein YciI
MPYVVLTHDKPDSLELRLATRASHLEYLRLFKDQVLAGGAFLEEDGALAGGAMIIFNTESLSEAENLIKNDPYTKADLFSHVEVKRWKKVFFDSHEIY